MRSFVLFLVATLATSISTRAVASVDMFLVIPSSGKEVAKTTTDSKGDFTFSKVPDGTYAVTFTYQKIEYKCDGSKNQPITVQTPRDAQSGMASGKRQHGSITITKEWGAASPQLKMTIDGNTISGHLRVLPTVNK